MAVGLVARYAIWVVRDATLVARDTRLVARDAIWVVRDATLVARDAREATNVGRGTEMSVE